MKYKEMKTMRNSKCSNNDSLLSTITTQANQSISGYDYESGNGFVADGYVDPSKYIVDSILKQYIDKDEDFMPIIEKILEKTLEKILEQDGFETIKELFENSQCQREKELVEKIEKLSSKITELELRLSSLEYKEMNRRSDTDYGGRLYTTYTTTTGGIFPSL